MTGAAAQATKITVPFLATNAQVAALTFASDVGEGRQGRVGGYVTPALGSSRDLFHSVDENARLLFGKTLHVSSKSFRAHNLVTVQRDQEQLRLDGQLGLNVPSWIIVGRRIGEYFTP